MGRAYVLDYIFLAFVIILYLIVAAVLVRKYLRTRDVGLLWLGAAVVIWPFVSELGQKAQRVVLYRRGHFPFSLIERGQLSISEMFRLLYFLNEFVALGILLTAVLYLHKTKKQQARGQNLT